ncbi:MAG: hypothetical protein AAGG72_00075 [Pseudomonadota bacterium]
MQPTRISNDDLRHVSTELDALRDRLSPAVHGGRILTSAEAIALMDELAALREHARALENEVSAHCWNEAGRIDRTDAANAALLQLVTDKDSNVVLFRGRDGGRR